MPLLRLDVAFPSHFQTSWLLQIEDSKKRNHGSEASIEAANAAGGKKRRVHRAAQQKRPTYVGAAPLNRFQILPGYRWDGLDRSNGFEAKWFLKKNEQSAQSVDAYRWSTENM